MFSYLCNPERRFQGTVLSNRQASWGCLRDLIKETEMGSEVISLIHSADCQRVRVYKHITSQYNHYLCYCYKLHAAKHRKYHCKTTYRSRSEGEVEVTVRVFNVAIDAMHYFAHTSRILGK